MLYIRFNRGPRATRILPTGALPPSSRPRKPVRAGVISIASARVLAYACLRLLALGSLGPYTLIMLSYGRRMLSCGMCWILYMDIFCGVMLDLGVMEGFFLYGVYV
ncbi:hypothetical protein DENSPDRAFT_855442 [Dentipellis sp. KUC8613]|nr:hypothetical protein DENSPDRAFT_855442 [Dentipellis sp. KUC8613]